MQWVARPWFLYNNISLHPVLLPKLFFYNGCCYCCCCFWLCFCHLLEISLRQFDLIYAHYLSQCFQLSDKWVFFLSICIFLYKSIYFICDTFLPTLGQTSSTKIACRLCASQSATKSASQLFICSPKMVMKKYLVVSFMGKCGFLV